jgi:hypothetical protein
MFSRSAKWGKMNLRHTILFRFRNFPGLEAEAAALHT